MQTPTIVFDPVAFLAFLASKPPGERYDFEDNENCPIAQYVKTQSNGLSVSCSTTRATVYINFTPYRFELPHGWTDAVMGNADTTRGLKAQWTWGRAAERFKARPSIT